VDEPVACSLDAAGARSQLDEWHSTIGKIAALAAFATA
jgi:hypothetical protein